MAFDLNKSEPAGKAKAQFDLSKGETTTTETPKSKNWMIGLLLVLLIGGGLWFYLAPSAPKTSGNSASANNSVKDSSTIENAPDKTLLAENNADTTGLVLNQQDLNARSLETKMPEGKSPQPLFDNKVAATFAQGSTSFAGKNTSMIHKLVKYLKANPSVSLKINGYASSDGPLSANEVIAQNRADVFKKYLVEQNIDENRIVALGKGIQNPIASNDTSAGRKKNRRVEINFE